MSLLLVEDEDRIASFIAKGLATHGFPVRRVGTGAEAVEAMSMEDPDLLILDLGLPDVDGIDLLKDFRATGRRVPVIVLSARASVDDRVLGLDVGADDYLPKPFAFDELLARIRARLRPQSAPTSTELRLGDLHMNLLTREVSVGWRRIELSTTEFMMLEAFLRHPRHVLSREQLLSAVWGFDYYPGSNRVEVYVRYLRQKLGPGYIETVRGAGYKIDEPGRA